MRKGFRGTGDTPAIHEDTHKNQLHRQYNTICCICQCIYSIYCDYALKSFERNRVNLDYCINALKRAYCVSTEPWNVRAY